MASTSTSSLESIIKSEQFQCRRVPNQSIPTVIVTNEASNSSNKNGADFTSGVSPTPVANAGQPGTPTKATEVSNKPKYGRVVISLENPILPEETILNTPSMADGLDRETENDLRITGCKLIQISGILLKLPQVAMATGQILFHRYYYSKSFVRFPMEITAMACVVLASKVEEAPRRIRDIINVFHNMKQIRLQQPPVPMLLDQTYVNLKNQVIKAERRILKELGFCVHVKHPHKYIITVAEILGSSRNIELIQTAWSYMNDSLHTNVFVRFPPEAIACACIHLSARILKVPLPTRPAWYLVFGVETETITQVCTAILSLYIRKPLSQEELEEKVELARKVVDDAKQKAKAQLVAQNVETSAATSLDSIMDSRTNSPVKYTEAAGGGTSSKSLEVLSVINRLKQAQSSGSGSAKTSPLVINKVKSAITVSSQTNSAQNSASSTPIKLEKSPRTLSSVEGNIKRSRSPSPRDKRRGSRERYQTDSYSSGDDRRSVDRSKTRYKNGHSINQHYDDESRYRDSDSSYARRSRSPPRSYVSSTVTISNSSDYPSKYQRRSRSPSYESDRYNNSRYSSSKSGGTNSSYRDRGSRYDDRYSSSGQRSRSRKDYDYDNRRSDRPRDYRENYQYGGDDNSRSRSRSPSGGYRQREYRNKSSRNRY